MDPGYQTQTEYTRIYVRWLPAKLERAGDQPLFSTKPRSGYRLRRGLLAVTGVACCWLAPAARAVR